MKQALSTIAQTLKVKLPDLWAVYVFGSQIDGTANAQSDVDIAVLGPVVIVILLCMNTNNSTLIFCQRFCSITFKIFNASLKLC